MRSNLIGTVKTVLYAAGGELIVRLCVASERLDGQRELALLRRQLKAAKKFGAYWHAKASEYRTQFERGVTQPRASDIDQGALN